MVDPETFTVAAITSSVTPSSAASRICARLILRAACRPPARRAFSSSRSAWLRSTWNFIVICASFSGGHADESQMSQSVDGPAAAAVPRYTQIQGQYLAFIYAYSRIQKRPPPEADMRRHFGVTAPSVHQMVLTLEKAGLITREPGAARSIQLLVAPEALPILR